MTTEAATAETSACAVSLRVTGMTCAGCAAAVQQSLAGVSGVRNARVSLDAGTAFVEGEALDAAALRSRIEARGFGAEVLEAEPDPFETVMEGERRQAAAARAWRTRAIVGLGTWIPLEILHWTVHAPWLPWLMAAGSTVVLAVAGRGFYASAWRAARHRTTNMDTLIALGATTAWAFSVVAFALQLAGRTAPPLYFAESAALLGIISLGHWIEARGTARTGSAIRELVALQPDEAVVVADDGAERTVSSRAVRPGDRLRLRPGGRVPVDGTIRDGTADLDESVVTGEAVPVPRGPGDTAVAGALVLNGTLIVEATTDGRHTTIARLARLVQEAQSTKAGIQRIADRVCAVFVPTVLAIAASTLFGWWLAGDPVRGVVAATTVLIISCPCALGLATPLAVSVGVGAASRRGILVKSAAVFERLGRAVRVVFDKTGTLTTGALRLVELRAADDDAAREALRLAASVEAASEHPLARAILAAAAQRGLAPAPVRDFRASPGIGVSGVVDGRTVRVERDESATCRVIVDGKTMAHLELADGPRDDAAAAVGALRAAGLEVHVLSGDRRAAVERVARAVGLDAASAIADATPDMKQAAVRDLGPGTVMVGDGINDAAALAAAEVGVAMGSGTNIAIEAADVVIPGDRVEAIPQTIMLARDTLRTIRQNLFFAFLYNACAIPAAAFGLLGTHGPLVAAAAMAASDITVIGNTLRLRRRLTKKP